MSDEKIVWSVAMSITSEEVRLLVTRLRRSLALERVSDQSSRPARTKAKGGKHLDHAL